MHGPHYITCILSLYYLQYTVSIDPYVLLIILYLPAHLDLLHISQMVIRWPTTIHVESNTIRTQGSVRLYLNRSTDAPLMRQHAWKCAEWRLRAQSPTQRSAGPAGRWCGNARATTTATHTQHSHQSSINRAPSPSYLIALKLGKNTEHLWYDASPANQGAAAPWSPSITPKLSWTVSRLSRCARASQAQTNDAPNGA